MFFSSLMFPLRLVGLLFWGFKALITTKLEYLQLDEKFYRGRQLTRARSWSFLIGESWKNDLIVKANFLVLAGDEIRLSFVASMFTILRKFVEVYKFGCTEMWWTLLIRHPSVVVQSMIIRHSYL